MEDHVTLLSAYEQGVMALKTAVADMTPEEIAFRPSADKWNTHEVVCHLADFELINAERIKRVIAEDRPAFLNAEPEPFATNLAYSQRNLAQELSLISCLRQHVATILRSLRPEQWQRAGHHSTDGELTVAQLVRRVTNHIPHHIRFIEAKKAAVRQQVRG
jgi:hypothetical protein